MADLVVMVLQIPVSLSITMWYILSFREKKNYTLKRKSFAILTSFYEKATTFLHTISMM